MGPQDIISLVIFMFIYPAQSKEYCGSVEDNHFYCETGHCCGYGKCCTYYKYYEMWWFWLVWCMILLIAGCCAYQKRRSHTNRANSRRRRTPVCPSRFLFPELSGRDFVVHFKLPSYPSVEKMAKLGPPECTDGAPPPYSMIVQLASNCTIEQQRTVSALIDPVDSRSLGFSNVVSSSCRTLNSAGSSGRSLCRSNSIGTLYTGHNSSTESTNYFPLLAETHIGSTSSNPDRPRSRTWVIGDQQPSTSTAASSAES